MGIKFFRENLILVRVAFSFYSRLPVGTKHLPTASEMNRAVRYFPLVGIVLCLLASVVMVFALWATGSSLFAAVAFFMSWVLLTGAFHEDGFADYCDGFGAFEKEKILLIMKDSRVGTYGVAGLVFLFLAKVSLFEHVLNESALTWNTTSTLQLILPLLFIAAASRWWSSIYMFTLNYIGDKATSKSKYAAESISVVEIIFGFITTITPLLFLYWIDSRFVLFLLSVFAVTFLVWWWCGANFKRRLNGYNGDCLGASQQIFEMFYFFILAVWVNFSATIWW